MNQNEPKISFNLLLQTIKSLDIVNHSKDELEMVYEILLSIDNNTLNHYHNNNSIFIYDNDLDLFIVIIKIVMLIFEEKEQFEKCHNLKLICDEALSITESKIKTNE